MSRFNALSDKMRLGLVGSDEYLGNFGLGGFLERVKLNVVVKVYL